MPVSGTRKTRDSVGSAMLTTLMSSVAITTPSASGGNARQRGSAALMTRARAAAIPSPSTGADPAQDLGQVRRLPVHQEADAEHAGRGEQGEQRGDRQHPQRERDLPG